MLKVIEIIDSDDDADIVPDSNAQECNAESNAQQQPNAPESNSEAVKPRKPRHQRKSVHHPMRATTPEFETVVLTPTSAKWNTVTELVNDVCAKFLNTNEGSALIRQIAEERVRINYLLTSYNMVDIGFTMGTGPERLKTQFEQRMRQRKLNKINNRSGEQQQQPQSSQQQEQTKLNKKRSNLNMSGGGGGGDRREEIKKRYSILQNYIPKTL